LNNKIASFYSFIETCFLNNRLHFPVIFFQIAELKAKRDQNQEQERQKKTRIEHLEKTVKHQQQELKKRASQVAEFERVSKYFNATNIKGNLYIEQNP